MSLLDKFKKFEEKQEEIKKETEQLVKEIKEKEEEKEKDIKPKPKPKSKQKRITTKPKVDKYQNQIDNLAKKNEELSSIINEVKDMISKTDIMKITTSPIIDKFEKFDKFFNFKQMRTEVIEDHELKPLDIFIETTKGRKPLLWDLKKVRELFPEYCKDKEEYFFVQLLNRMERDGRKYIEFTIDYTKKRLIDFIQNNG